MIDTVLRWLLSRADAETVQRSYVKKLYILAERLDATYEEIGEKVKLEKQLEIIAFNIKYKGAGEDDKSPHDTFLSYILRAKNRDHAFLASPLYAAMKGLRDKKVHTLRTILNRNRK